MKALYIFFLALTVCLFFVLPVCANEKEANIVFMYILASILGAFIFGTLWADQPQPQRSHYFSELDFPSQRVAKLRRRS